MLNFVCKEEAVQYALQNHYHDSFFCKVEGEILSTEKVDRYWAVRHCPNMYVDLFDENPDEEYEEIE